MNEVLRKLLLAIDGSEDAALAARAAVDLADRTGAGLHVVHAWQPMYPYVNYPASVSTDFVRIYEERAGSLLGVQVDQIEAEGGAVEESHLVMGAPVEAILELCGQIEPDLIVVGSRGMGPIRRVLTGSVSEGVVHHAGCPVLVVRGGEGGWPPSRILIGDDGSGDAERAARLAARLGALYGVGAALVRAYENPPSPIGGWSAEDRRRLDETLVEEEAALDRRADEVEKVLGSRPETRMVEGDATMALLEIAGEEEKTLFAVGSRGLGLFSRLRLGSVSTKVLRTARGPVLVCTHHSG
ncbi:MAG TPA: universal stress protein [Rubrobacteraceae bacterium]|nr:universal stress protein [Rubrobacteraceae bacterium]